MKLIAENDGYELFYDWNAVNRYKVFKLMPDASCFKQEVARSPNFTKKLKSYFTKQQVDTAIAKVHAFNYTSRKFIA